MKMNRVRQLKVYAILFVLLFSGIMIFSACSMLGNLLDGAGIKKPEVDFVGASLSGLSFDAADLMFDLKIKNPNRVGVKLAGFDYDFLINEDSFLKGQQDKGIEIAADGEEVIQLPLSLRFMDLYQVFQSLKDQGASNYRVNMGFSFNLPVLGDIRIPVSKSGEFPLIKLPKLSLSFFKLDRITISGANLKLGIKLSNPNIFSMAFSRMKYQFKLNGQSLASGEAIENTQIKENGEGLIEIPISLDFIQLGRSVYQLLNSNSNLNYQLTGDLDIATSHPLLGKTKLPFDLSGQTELIR